MTAITAFAWIAGALIYFLAVDEQTERDAEGRYVFSAMHHVVAAVFVGFLWIAALVLVSTVDWVFR